MFKPLPIPEVEHAPVNGVETMCDNRCLACNTPVRIFPHKIGETTTCPRCKTRMMVEVRQEEGFGLMAAWIEGEQP